MNPVSRSAAGTVAATRMKATTATRKMGCRNPNATAPSNPPRPNCSNTICCMSAGRTWARNAWNPAPVSIWAEIQTMNTSNRNAAPAMAARSAAWSRSSRP